MNSIVIMIAITEAKHAASDLCNGDTIIGRFKAAIAATKNHWCVVDGGERFRAAVGGLMLSYGEGTPEFEQLQREMAQLNQLEAFLAAAKQGLSVSLPEPDDDFKPIGLVKIWNEESK